MYTYIIGAVGIICNSFTYFFNFKEINNYSFNNFDYSNLKLNKSNKIASYNIKD
jgi:hypothetical protein